MVDILLSNLLQNSKCRWSNSPPQISLTRSGVTHYSSRLPFVFGYHLRLATALVFDPEPSRYDCPLLLFKWPGPAIVEKVSILLRFWMRLVNNQHAELGRVLKDQQFYLSTKRATKVRAGKMPWPSLIPHAVPPSLDDRPWSALTWTWIPLAFWWFCPVWNWATDKASPLLKLHPCERRSPLTQGRGNKPKATKDLLWEYHGNGCTFPISKRQGHHSSQRLKVNIGQGWIQAACSSKRECFIKWQNSESPPFKCLNLSLQSLQSNSFALLALFSVSW